MHQLDNDAPEWVLLVPPKLTETAFEALKACRCITRPWEVHGRTGARIHPHSKSQVGIPVARRDVFMALVETADGSGDLVDAEDTVPSRAFLRNLFHNTPGVELIQKQFTPSRTAKIFEEKPYDARFHPERAPDSFNVSNMLATASTLTPFRDTTPAFTYAELFAGIGGFGVALERLGGTCIFCSELEESCRSVYTANFPETTNVVGDILAVPDHDLPRAGTLDMLVAGFPCQPFSSLGQQPGLTCPKGNLFLEIVRLLNVSQPRAFLLENVPGLFTLTNDLNVIMTALKDAGYDVSIEVCNARGLTACTRKRLYFVGLRQGEQDDNKPFEFPFIPDLGLRARDILSYEDCADNDFLRVTDEQFARLLEEKHWRPAHLAWPNTVCSPLVSHYGNSIAQGNSQLVPCCIGNPRRFSPRECARIMGFPNSYRLPEKPRLHQGEMAFVKEQYRMLGNAVCPPVIAALAGAVLAHCPSIQGHERHADWVVWSRQCAVELALAATISHET